MVNICIVWLIAKENNKKTRSISEFNRDNLCMSICLSVSKQLHCLVLSLFH